MDQDCKIITIREDEYKALHIQIANQEALIEKLRRGPFFGTLLLIGKKFLRIQDDRTRTYCN